MRAAKHTIEDGPAAASILCNSLSVNFLHHRDASASEKSNGPGKSCQGQLRSLIRRRGVGKAGSDRGRNPKPDVTVRPLQCFAAKESVEIEVTLIEHCLRNFLASLDHDLLLDQFSGGHSQHQGNEPERLGGLAVNDEFELGRLLAMARAAERASRMRHDRHQGQAAPQ
jgi:hypothetical protein